MSKIKQVKARQVLDSNGRPVVEVDILTESGAMGRAGASTGTSVGTNESYVLRDRKDNFWGGLSVFKAVENVEKVIGPALIGMEVQEQQGIDRRMIELDGTRYKTNLGGNAIYAVSCAAAYAAAAENHRHIYQNVAKKPIEYIMSPSANVINGGTYNGKTMPWQEFMVLPYGMKDVNESIRMIVEIFYRLGDVLKKYNNGKAAMGNYSGWGAPSDDPYEVMEILSDTVAELGYTKNIVYAFDCASSEYYDEAQGLYRWRGQMVDRDYIIGQLAGLADKYPVAFIEDALWEEDFEGFALASKKINSVIIGDDFICTSMDRAKKAVEMGAARGMIFKPNQAGTITEAIETATYMMDQGLLVVPSSRAGGTLDSPEKELGLALGVWAVKTGAPREGSRVHGFNFLMHSAEELQVPMTNVMELPIFAHLQKK